MDRTILKSPFRLNERGFTAVELVTYIVLAGITFGGALILFQSSMDSYVSVAGRSLALEEVHHAVRTIARDVQSVRDKNSITTANATTFTFVNSKNQTVSLTYASQQITRSGTVIAKNVSSFGLTYRKWDGTAWTSGSTGLIARVLLTMTVTSGGQSVTVNESFLIRNTR
jgi:Tfp pilus assembly protein PilE